MPLASVEGGDNIATEYGGSTRRQKTCDASKHDTRVHIVQREAYGKLQVIFFNEVIVGCAAPSCFQRKMKRGGSAFDRQP